MRFRRTAATIVLASILLAACGPGDADGPATQADDDPAPAPAEPEPEPAADAVADEPDDAAGDATGDDDAAGDSAALPPADEPDTDEPPAEDDTDEPPADDTDEPAGEPADQPADEPADDQPADDPEPEPDEVVPTMAWPDDGCSADNSPTPTDLADAPPPVLELRPESADSPLPEVAVRRLNCNGGWVNFRNELPSELPLLVWFWAPH